MPQEPISALEAAYLERRAALVRYFASRTGSAADAEDLAQELFLKVMAAPDAEAVSNPGAYLFRQAFNLMLDKARGRTRGMARDRAYRDLTVEHAAGPDRADDPGAERALVAKDRLARLVTRLQRLPAKTREAFRLHKFEGLSQGETAERMGVSKSSIERWMSDALKDLAEDER